MTDIWNTIISIGRFILDSIQTFLELVENLVSWIGYAYSLLTLLIPTQIQVFILLGLIVAIVVWLLDRN